MSTRKLLIVVAAVAGGAVAVAWYQRRKRIEQGADVASSYLAATGVAPALAAFGLYPYNGRP